MKLTESQKEAFEVVCSTRDWSAIIGQVEFLIAEAVDDALLQAETALKRALINSNWEPKVVDAIRRLRKEQKNDDTR